MAGDLHHTAQPSTLAVFRPWGDSTGAGCVRPAAAKLKKYFQIMKIITIYFFINPQKIMILASISIFTSFLKSND